MFAIELPQGCLSESSPHAPGVIEHVVVLEGKIELFVEGGGKRWWQGKCCASRRTSRMGIATGGRRQRRFTI
ncbi:hypothetical protein F0A16_07475 [Salinicola corii]|uniref:Cupin 2 conserved barrel domain-containing protein n=1 Tax=Salinicola corii TaxID=2606937 RepID=A0A640WFZ9_9GAMM|nr:hypothetical protein [Salinicola corii]KAA0019173.1 hypothetical protein F0A16_07475 [Salinicola corii]